MKNLIIGAAIVCAASAAYGEESYTTSKGTYIIPDSSIRQSSDRANRIWRSFNVLFKPNSLNSNGLPNNCETPASLACVYGLTPQVSGCPIDGTTAVPTGGAGTTIAIVDADHNSTQIADLATYSAKFGLPAADVTVYNGSTCIPGRAPNEGWQDEHQLDLDMVHAMAPNAKIDMVEAVSANDDDMIAAEQCATSLITAVGGGIVSNSWGGDEYPTETARDVNFQNPGVVYIFSSGDYSAPARYPSSSPYVISAGASSILRDANGNFIGEGAWNSAADVPIGSKSGTSGGPSLYESRPYFQRFVQKIVGAARGTPDISFDGDPKTGVCIYSSYQSRGWLRDGGTSVAAPALAGILDTAVYRATSSQDMLNYIYYNSLKNYHSYWNDGIVGYNGYPALSGCDFVTGLGTVRGYEGK